MTNSTLEQPNQPSKKTSYQELIETLAELQKELEQTDCTEKDFIQIRIEEVTELVERLSSENKDRILNEAERDESFFGKIANRILDAEDLDGVFRTATKELKEVLNCDRAAIYRFNPDWSGRFVAEYFEGNLVSLLEEQRYNPDIVDNVNACSIKDLAHKGGLLQPNYGNGNGNGNGSIDTYLKATRGGSFLRGETYRVCQDIYNSNFTPCYIRVLKSYQAEAYVIAAVYQGNNLWGLLAAYQSKPRQWKDGEIDVVVQLAKMLNIALQQQDFQNKVEIQAKKLATRNQREKSLAKIVDRIRETDNIKTILNVTVSDIREMMQCDRVAIYHFNPDWSGEFIAESANSEWVSLLEEQRNVPEIVENVNRCSIRDLAGYEGVAGGSKSLKESADTYLQQTNGRDFIQGVNYRVCEDIYNSGFSDCYIKVLERYQAKAYIIAAIYYNKQLWGLLAVYQNSGPRKWEAEEIELISRFASQIGVGIRQTGYLKTIKAQNKRLKKSAQQEQTLAKVVDRILQSTELQETLDNTMPDLRNLLNADRVAVYKICFEAGNRHGKFIAEDVDKKYPRAVSVERVEDHYSLGNEAEIYEQDNYWVVEDIYQTKFKESKIKIVTQFETKAYINVALLCQGKLWGLLCVHQCGDTRKWQQEEINLALQVSTQLSVAIERSEYVKQLEAKQAEIIKTADSEKAISLLVERLTERINQSQDLSQIWRSSLLAVRKIIECDRVTIYRFNPDWSGEYIAESVSSDWVPLVGDNIKTIWEDTHLQETQGGRYRNNETYAIEDIYKAGHYQCHIDLLEQFQVRAYIIAPIFAGDKLWGLLAAYQNTGPRQWNDREQRLITKLGVQFGLAVKQAEYLQQLQQQNSRLVRTAQIEKKQAELAERIRQDRNLDSIFNLVTGEIRQLLNCDRVVVYRFNDDWSGEFIAEAIGSSQWVSLLEQQNIRPEIKANVNDCSVKDLAANQNSRNSFSADTEIQATKGGNLTQDKVYRVCEDIYNSGFSDCYIKVLETYQTKAYVISAIYQNGELWGLFAAYQNDRPRQWQEEEIDLMTGVAEKLSISLEQAEYIKQLQAKNKEIAQVVETEKALGLLGERIRQTKDLDAVFKYTLPEIRDLLKCDRIVVYRFNPDWSGKIIAESVTEGWISLMDLQESDSKIRNDLVPSDDCTVKEYGSLQGDGFGDTYLQENKGGIYSAGRRYRKVNDVSAENFSACYLDTLRKFQAKAYINAPIYQGGKLWALLAVYQNSGPRVWQDREVDLLVKISVQYSIAVQQAQYFQEVQDKNEKLTRLLTTEKANARFLSRLPSRLIDLAQSTGKIAEILDYAVRDLRQLLKVDRVGIYRFDPDWSGEFIVESVGSQWPKLVGTSQARVQDTYLQENQGGRYARREGLKVDNIYTVGHDECHINLLAEWGTKAYTIAPIFVGDLLWGLLGVYQNDQPRQWEQSELDVSIQTGIQIGTAIKLAETLEKVKKQEQQLSEIADREKTARQQLQKNALKVLKAVQPSFSGDLTVRAPLSEDEIGTIADGYNTTIQRLRQLVGQVKQVASRIGETSTDSDRLVSRLSNKADQQVQELRNALVQLNSVVASSQTVANDAQKVEQALQDANRIVNSGDSLMEKTVDGIEEIRETVSETSKKIKRLGEASQKITKVVNLIENFATQTNLLALNAAIEATRAGEYGKGFAVVADEVRALAYQSANATTEISRIVAEIQAETSEVTETMELGITQVVQGTQLVNDTRDSLNEIVRATNRISQLVEKITQAASVQSQQCQGLTTAMNDVSSIATSTSDSASSIAESFQKLRHNSQELQTSVSKFKVE
ncbi:MAG: GAF domain-containing protein [Prochloraceae cyanobacterium]